MVISDRPRCIFVHIQKTGGASIEALLLRSDPSAAASAREGRRHPTARAIAPIAGSERWRAYFKFDFARVCERIGVTFELPHVNRSAHGPYRDYYSKATKGVVAERFARDIAHFGYRF